MVHKKKYEGRNQYPVTPIEFAKTWNLAETAEEASRKLGMPLPIVLARVSNYRKRGIFLKKMPRKNSRRLDVEKINESTKRQNKSLVGKNPVIVERVLVLPNERVTTPRPRGLSVRIHLFDGTPDGLRVVERIHSNLRAIACSKSRLREVKGRPELVKPSVYVLVGSSESGTLPIVYIGEADPAWPRLENHLAKKQFWDSIVLFTSKDDGLHKAHIQFLESKLTVLSR